MYMLACSGPGGSTNQTININVVSSVSTSTTPPVISNPAPSGTLPAGTTATSLTVTTNESATCAYSSNASAAFSAMTPFSTTGGTNHVASLSALTNGTSHTYYVLCEDSSGNMSTLNTDNFLDCQSCSSCADRHHLRKSRISIVGRKFYCYVDIHECYCMYRIGWMDRY